MLDRDRMLGGALGCSSLARRKLDTGKDQYQYHPYIFVLHRSLPICLFY
jgi:hypothetical protein